MDVPTLSLFLRPILTVASVWNTGETGDINASPLILVALSLAIRGVPVPEQCLIKENGICYMLTGSHLYFLVDFREALLCMLPVSYST